MKQITLGLTLLSILFTGVSLIEAADPIGDYAPAETLSCIDLKNNLILTSRDARTNNEVTSLQEFLQAKGYLESDPTGYFGSMTKAAVIKFQVSVPLAGTGYVGPLTRAEIKRVTCGSATTTPGTATTTSTALIMSTSNSASGPWTVNGSVYNYGGIYTKITGLVKANFPTICISSSAVGCPSTRFRAIASNEWIAGNTSIVVISPAGTVSNGSYVVYVAYPGESSKMVGNYYVQALPPSHSWVCVTPGPATVNTASYSCSSANVNTTQKIDGYDCYCKAAQYMNTGIATSTLTQTPTTPTPPVEPICKDRTLDGRPPFSVGGGAGCTIERNGQFSPSDANIYCSCNGLILTENPAVPTLAAKVSNSASGPWSTTAYNSGKIYVRTTGLVRANGPKACASASGSTGCLLASNQRDFVSSTDPSKNEWIDDRTAITVMDGGTIPNGSYDFYVAYPNKNAVKVGTASLTAGQSTQPTQPTQPTQSTQLRGFASNSLSGPWLENGTVSNKTGGLIYSKTSGVDKSRHPKGCASPSGASGCENLANHREFTAEELKGDSGDSIITVVQGGQFPNGSYDVYISYSNGQIIKTGTFTITATYKWSCAAGIQTNNNTSAYACSAANYGQRYPAGNGEASINCTCALSTIDIPSTLATENSNQILIDTPSTSATFIRVATNILENISKQVSDGFTMLNSMSGSVGVNASTKSKACVNVSRNLHRGDESVQTTKLQQFLIDKGFLSEKASGFFGDLTLAAVKAYQASVGLPQTGMVYDLTRQAIQAETCK